MPPRNDDRRNALQGRLLALAEQAAAAEGISGFSARALASGLGISVGGIYNLVPSMDDLILKVASRTLEALDRELAAAQADKSDPVDRLVAIAEAYLEFASANRGRWGALFEHRMANGESTPDWAVKEQLRLFRHIVGPLSELLPGRPADEIAMQARTFFSAVHGIVFLGLDRRMIAVPIPLLAERLGNFVRAAARGIAQG